jgi:hypothetical protein
MFRNVLEEREGPCVDLLWVGPMFRNVLEEREGPCVDLLWAGKRNTVVNDGICGRKYTNTIDMMSLLLKGIVQRDFSPLLFSQMDSSHAIYSVFKDFF